MNTSDATAWSTAFVPVWAIALAAATLSSRVFSCPLGANLRGPASKLVRGVADPFGWHGRERTEPRDQQLPPTSRGKIHDLSELVSE